MYPQFHTVSVAHLGATAKGGPPCEIQANAINCNVNGVSGEAFKTISVRYTLNEVTTPGPGGPGGNSGDHTNVTAYIWNKRQTAAGGPIP